VRIYLAGWQATRRLRELELIQRSGIKHRCYSFANLYKIPNFPYFIDGKTHVCGTFEGAYQACLENKVGIMMDSGVFSYRNYKKLLIEKGKLTDKFPTQDQFIHYYVDYVKQFHKKWDWYATVDMEWSAPKIFKWHSYVVSLGIKPVPVFHGDASIDWLKKYHDLGHTFIALGSTKSLRASNKHWAQYLDNVFNVGVKLGLTFHGLGMTQPWMMLGYDFASVDSSWWTRSAGFGSIMQWDDVKERMSILHISPRSSEAKGQVFKQNLSAMQRLREEVGAAGFDLDVLCNDFVERHIWNARTMMALLASANKRSRGTWSSLV
jgi:hypothetical protein